MTHNSLASRRVRANLGPKYHGQRDFPALGMVRVGPCLWLKLSKPHRYITTSKRFSGTCGAFPEYDYYRSPYRARGEYIDGRAGWGSDGLVLLSGFCFDTSNHRYNTKQTIKYKERERDARKRTKSNQETSTQDS